MKYITKFTDHAAYSAAESSLVKPNVSYCVSENDVHYKPIEPPSRVLTAVFNIIQTSEPTIIASDSIDGWNDVESVLVTRPNGTTFTLTNEDLGLDTDGFRTYQFDMTGNHTFEYTLKPNVNTLTNALFAVVSLLSVNIPNSITVIANRAFFYCSDTTLVTIPNSVTSIGEETFYQCYDLTSVICLATTPPTLGRYAFDSTNNCPIYVPAESVDTYKAASGWSDYASRIQAIPTE